MVNPVCNISILRHHVERLASDIGVRNLWNYEALKASEDHITQAFKNLGYTPHKQNFTVHDKEVSNISVEIKGENTAEPMIVLGAHYDTVSDSPGANDNGTGIAALLELAHIFSEHSFSRTIRFVAFVNEEPPFFHSENMGSLVYAKAMHKKNERVKVMLSLESLGYYSDKQHSQEYPFPLSLLYPHQANFIGFVSNLHSKTALEECVQAFKNHSDFPLQKLTAPEIIPGVSWSDHWAFWRMGYPAIMITDTAPYRYPHYHTSEDTIDKIDFQKLTALVDGFVGMISTLAGLTQPALVRPQEETVF